MLDLTTQKLIEVWHKRIKNFCDMEQRFNKSQSNISAKERQEFARESEQIRQMRPLLVKYEQLLEAQSLVENAGDDIEITELATEEVETLSQRIHKDAHELLGALVVDDDNAGKDLILEIRAATGGAEAALFVANLLRMYKQFAQRKNLKIDLLSFTSTGIGGYKEVVCEIRGKTAFQCFKFEAGTHRVQRIPETEAGGRIHTSTVTVAILPVREASEVKIRNDDLEIDVYRASGAGGQHVNTTESAIRITHKPTGIVVTCQDERSQHKNRAKALKVLYARLAQHDQAKRHEEEASLKRSQVKTGERSERVRTYNFPQGRLTDHRIGFTVYNLLEIMDGAMDELWEALFVAQKKQRIEQYLQLTS